MDDVNFNILRFKKIYLATHKNLHRRLFTNSFKDLTFIKINIKNIQNKT